MELGEILGLSLLALNLLWTIAWSIHMRGQVASAKNDERISDHRERIVKLESHMDHFPNKVASHDDVEKVHNRVSSLRGVVDKLAALVGKIASQVASTAATVDSINGNLDLLNRSELLNEGRNKDD